MLGKGIQFPSTGPLFHDFELLHPLMPLLLELSNADGSTTHLTLIPFPSLLPGGLHGAELKALQIEPNPIDDFWAQSEALLQEAIGGVGWPPRAVTKVSLADEDSSLEWRALQSPVKEWLLAVFKIPFEEIDTSLPQGHELILPANSVPTIRALVSRRPDVVPGEALIGAYLVVDTQNYRPRWSVTLPVDEDATSTIPRLEGIATAQGGSESAWMPLAITICQQNAKIVSAVPEFHSLELGPLSVLVYASDALRAECVIQALQTFGGKELDLLVSYDEADGDLQLALDRACGGRAWTQVHSADPRHVAKKALHETLLTVSDRVALDDRGAALAAVLNLLRRQETAGSVSCALVGEKIVKNEVVLQPATGGLFPTGVSFVSGPGLAFGEPDVQQALPGRTYPVVANTLLFTAWRRSALLQLPSLNSTRAAGYADIRTGLDLIQAGYKNWCTTQVTARLKGPFGPRDKIDPVGPGYLPPVRWANILRQVTVVRELF
jgi:hypothetical protein